MYDPDGTTTHYNKYFGISHFQHKPYYGGHYGDDNDNHFDLFSVSGLDFIVFYFEYGRYGSGVLNWANDVLATNETRRVIVVTHYAGSDTTPSNLSAQGQALYDGLKANTNFSSCLAVMSPGMAGKAPRSKHVSGEDRAHLHLGTSRAG